MTVRETEQPVEECADEIRNALARLAHEHEESEATKCLLVGTLRELSRMIVLQPQQAVRAGEISSALTQLAEAFEESAARKRALLDTLQDLIRLIRTGGAGRYVKATA